MTSMIEPKRSGFQRPAIRVVVILLAIVLSWWAIEVLDTYLLDDRLQRNGIRPRQRRGLWGILTAPFLHSDFGHLISNTFPFLALSALVLIRGVRRWVNITMLGYIFGGALTWAFAGGSNHIGASGLVFCYFGALLGAAVFERRAAAFAPALVTVMLYSTMLVGLVPQRFISWEGHLSGFLVGIAASKIFAEPRSGRDRASKQEARTNSIFGDSEPWLDVPHER